ncbi:MAG: hypothetical protein KKB21_02285 [Nanoarchaeota archaeon]|nr:hypothetical protein [Nanoarchaeota archaeon]MBU4086384.1 hypothetical protein [Nanoarchaeota archaeon]
MRIEFVEVRGFVQPSKIGLEEYIRAYCLPYETAVLDDADDALPFVDLTQDKPARNYVQRMKKIGRVAEA